MLRMTFLFLALICLAGANELQISDFFSSWENKEVFPPLEKRELLDNAEVEELQKMWKFAQETGLVKDRHKIWLKLLGGDSRKYLTSFLKYRNPEIIELVEEMFFWEFECYRFYEKQEWARAKSYQQARCAEEIPVTEDDYEQEADYYTMVSTISLSTLSPKIFDPVFLHLFSTGAGISKHEYYSHVNVEEHLLALLTPELDARTVNYPRGPSTSVSLVYSMKERSTSLSPGIYCDLVIHMLVINPGLAVKFEDNIRQLVQRLRNTDELGMHALDESLIKGLVDQANRLEYSLERILHVSGD